MVWVSALKDTQTDLSFTAALLHLIEKIWQILELVTLSFQVKTMSFGNTGFLLSGRVSDMKIVSDMILITLKFETHSVPHPSTIKTAYKKIVHLKCFNFLRIQLKPNLYFLLFFFTTQQSSHVSRNSNSCV